MSISFNFFCQNGQIIGQILNKNKQPYFGYLEILLKKNDSTLKGTVADTTGKFHLNKIPDGIYSLVIDQIGSRDFTTDSIKIFNDSILNFNLTYPPPCMFVYIKGKKPRCIGGHTDPIIPIVYGLLSQKTMQKAKEGLIHLGGCIISSCDPHYYCIIHKKQL